MKADIPGLAGIAHGRMSADSQDCIGKKHIGRDLKVKGRRSLSDPPGCVVLGTVAGAEPAIPIPHRITRPLPKRNAAQMGANAYHDQPLGALRACFVSLGIAQFGSSDGSGLRDPCLTSVIDEHRP